MVTGKLGKLGKLKSPGSGENVRLFGEGGAADLL